MLLTCGWLLSATVLGQTAPATDIKEAFFKLCDVACAELNTDARRVPFYIDSYAIRALAVGYDMTGKRRYIEVCRRWSDRMIDFQDRMVPRGAYYMNYNRKPGEEKGGWYVADSSSIAMGVLATAVRCDDPAQRSRYFESVTWFAKLVMDNYLGKSGGIRNGLWDKFDGEWWCCTGIFGSLSFLLYQETMDDQYLEVGRRAIEWLNRQDWAKTGPYPLEMMGPAMAMYSLEVYSAGESHLPGDSEIRKATAEQVTRFLDWLAAHPGGSEGDKQWPYKSQWGSKYGGLPFHIYICSRYLPTGKNPKGQADRLLDEVVSFIFAAEKPALSQVAAFAMMSCAERVRPGGIYRQSSKVISTQPQ